MRVKQQQLRPCPVMRYLPKAALLLEAHSQAEVPFLLLGSAPTLSDVFIWLSQDISEILCTYIK